MLASSNACTSRTSVVAPPDAKLQAALTEFGKALTAQQRSQFLTHQTSPSINEVIKLTAEIDAEQAQRGAQCIGTRLHSILESICDFSATVDTFVSSNPATAALVWGSVKFSLVIAMKVPLYMQGLSRMFMEIKNEYPRLVEYQALFEHSLRVRAALYNFYAAVVSCCRHILLSCRNQGFLQFAKAALHPAESEIAPLKQELCTCGKEVREEIALASTQSAIKERRLQLVEREAATKFRHRASTFFGKTDKANAQTRQWQLNLEARESRMSKQQSLRKLSDYNYRLDYNRARKKQHGATTSWLVETQQYKSWFQSTTSTVLWFSGKLGSGKTVATANAISDLYHSGLSSENTIIIFFCRFDAAESLVAGTILRSLLRQSLEANGLDNQTYERLESLLAYSEIDTDSLVAFLSFALMLRGHIVVVDGLDECLHADQEIVLTAISSLLGRISHQTRARVFLSGRESLTETVKDKLPVTFHVSTDSTGAADAISTYIDLSIDLAYQKKELEIGNVALLTDIKDALKERAQGMFLWVDFQIRDICMQTCDRDIIATIGSLPRNLPDTYLRLLQRIIRNGRAETVRKAFEWIIIAKCPLTIYQVQEAIAVEPCQPFSNPERLLNNPSRLITWCESLVVLDEEDCVIQFTHETVRTFLLNNTLGASLTEFLFKEAELETKAGDICVTYLCFSDFERALARTTDRDFAIDPAEMLQKALFAETNWLARTAARVVSQRQRRSSALDHEAVKRILIDTARIKRVSQLEHPFLAYASVHWPYHTSSLTRQNPTWHLFQSILDSDFRKDIVKNPWTPDDWEHRTQQLCNWIIENRHEALFDYIEKSSTPFHMSKIAFILQDALRCRSLRMIDIILSLPSRTELSLPSCLVEAAKANDTAILERLLASGVAVDVAVDRIHPGLRESDPDYTWTATALQVAAAAGNTQSVEFLLLHGADVNKKAFDWNGLTALQAAASKGHEVLVQLLLRHQADVNARTAQRTTALTLAAKHGHLKVVEHLLEHGANVNGEYNDFLEIYQIDHEHTSPLLAACQGGHLSIVAALLAREPKPNPNFRLRTGRKTALHLAVERGDCTMVRMLLRAPGLQPLALSAIGDTPLSLAGKQTRLDIVAVLTKAIEKQLRQNNFDLGEGTEAYVEFMETHMSLHREASQDPWRFHILYEDQDGNRNTGFVTSPLPPILEQ